MISNSFDYYAKNKERKHIEKNKNILLALSRALQEKRYKIEGKKKLMKLMFLIEHYDPEQDIVNRTGRFGNKFYIYNYGVFSVEVLKSIDELMKEGYLMGEYPDLDLNEERLRKTHIEINKTIKVVVEKIVKQFGHMSGWELERKTLEMLGIDYLDKEKYKGLRVDDILTEQQ